MEDKIYYGVRVNYYGDIQGVGFRYRSIMLAKEFSVVGYVKNNSDGSVFIEAISPSEEKLNHFLEALKKQSPGKIDTAEEKNFIPDQIYSHFEVRY